MCESGRSERYFTHEGERDRRESHRAQEHEDFKGREDK